MIMILSNLLTSISFPKNPVYRSIDAWIDQQTDIMYIKQEPENQEHQQLLSNLSDVITSSFDKYPNVPSACE